MTQEEEMRIRETARNYLCGYQLCLDMLKLRKYERKRAAKFDELCDCEDILAGDEAYWKARIYEIAAFLGKMKNGREKMLLYYRYVKGESVERAAGLMGLSRRTAYRLWNKALLSAGLLLNAECRMQSVECRVVRDLVGTGVLDGPKNNR